MTFGAFLVLGLLATTIAHDEQLGPGDRRIVGVLAALAGGGLGQAVIAPDSSLVTAIPDVYVLLLSLTASVMSVIVADAIAAVRRPVALWLPPTRSAARPARRQASPPSRRIRASRRAPRTGTDRVMNGAANHQAQDAPGTATNA